MPEQFLGTSYDIFYSLGVVLHVILAIVAIRDMSRIPNRSAVATPLWVLIITLLPLIGPICYLVVGSSSLGEHAPLTERERQEVG